MLIFILLLFPGDCIVPLFILLLSVEIRGEERYELPVTPENVASGLWNVYPGDVRMRREEAEADEGRTADETEAEDECSADICCCGSVCGVCAVCCC